MPRTHVKIVIISFFEVIVPSPALIVKQTVSKRIVYKYWYAKHIINDKIEWYHIGQTSPEQYQQLAHNTNGT